MSLALTSRRAALLPGRWVSNELWRRARAVPSLDLRFAESKSLVDAVSGQQLITFTRASAGTYVGSDGLIKTATTDVPRFDHDPVTGESLGLLVEESRTNLLLWSEEFDNPTWSATDASVSANQTIAPDGNTTADKLVCGTGTPTYQGIAQSITATSSVTRFSVYVKAAGLDQIELRSFLPNDGAVFDLSTQQVLSEFGAPAPTITDAGNGWYRCSITSSTSGITSFRISLASGGSRTFAPISGAGLYIWGAQLEAGAFPTSYIPTTDSAVTRAADVASITGANFSSWYRQDEGTVFADFQLNPVSLGDYPFSINDNSFANRQTIFPPTTTSLRYRSITSSIEDVTITFATIAGGRRKGVGAYRVNDFAFALDTGGLLTDTSAGVPPATQLNIGSEFNGSGFLNRTIRRLTYWPQRLPNSTLQNITL